MSVYTTVRIYISFHEADGHMFIYFAVIVIFSFTLFLYIISTFVLEEAVAVVCRCVISSVKEMR